MSNRRSAQDQSPLHPRLPHLSPGDLGALESPQLHRGPSSGPSNGPSSVPHFLVNLLNRDGTTPPNGIANTLASSDPVADARFLRLAAEALERVQDQQLVKIDPTIAQLLQRAVYRAGELAPQPTVPEMFPPTPQAFDPGVAEAFFGTTETPDLYPIEVFTPRDIEQQTNARPPFLHHTDVWGLPELETPQPFVGSPRRPLQRTQTASSAESLHSRNPSRSLLLHNMAVHNSHRSPEEMAIGDRWDVMLMALPGILSGSGELSLGGPNGLPFPRSHQAERPSQHGYAPELYSYDEGLGYGLGSAGHEPYIALDEPHEALPVLESLLPVLLLLSANDSRRPYICSNCLLLFRRLSDLRRHLKAHLKTLPHTCPKCSKGFARKDALKRHVGTLTCKRNREKNMQGRDE